MKEDTGKNIREDIIEGRNAVLEALRAGKTLENIMISKDAKGASINTLIKLAKKNNVVVKKVDKNKLDNLSAAGVHQGVIAITTPYKYCSVKDILDYAEQREEKPFIVILDEIQDPHNFGSIIRTAEIFGVHGIIIPKRRSVGVTSTVYKVSTGAIEYMKIAKVSNINNTIDDLKSQGVWIYGADMEGESYCYDIDFSFPTALVIGSEGKGISKLTKKKCDVLVKIPMVGKINSLNASVAGSIIMYEVLKNRLK